MKYLFFGTPEFAAIILEKLIGAGFAPAGVICNPDRPVGRKKVITPPPTKVLAQKYGIPVSQPEKLKDFKINNADFAIVAAYSKIIPKDILESFKLGVIGVHPSLLPKYRGATPIQTAILNGEKETGVTLYLMDEKVDHGAIISASKLPISDSDTYETLEKKLAEAAGDLLVKIIPGFIGKKIESEPQDENRATYTKKFETKDAQVDLEKDNPVEIERKVRALNPEPGAWTMKDGRRMKILEAELNPPTGGGKLVLKKIQYEGKKPQVVN
ncbi:MAG: methionyl-tRNA formyltransferase [Minisyncoccia bacterium]